MVVSSTRKILFGSTSIKKLFIWASFLYMRKCELEQCNNKYFASGYCRAHLNHIRRYGEIRRLQTEPNEVTVEGNVARISIYNKNRKKILETMVDSDMVEQLIKTRWAFNGQYIKEATSKHVNYLHHNIIGKPENGLVVDHINRDKLDNRKENLRFVTRAENNINR